MFKVEKRADLMPTSGVIKLLWVIAIISAAHGCSRSSPEHLSESIPPVIVNEPPRVSKPIEKIAVQGGQFHKKSLEGHFHDDKDTILSYGLENVRENWIYVAGSELCILMPSERPFNPTQLRLIAEDSGGLNVSLTLTIVIIDPPSIDYDVWPYYFEFSFPSFPNWREFIHKNITQSDNSKFILVRAKWFKRRDLTHISVRYVNESLGGYMDCPLCNIAKVANEYRNFYADFRYRLYIRSGCENNYKNNSPPFIQNAFIFPNVSDGELFEFKVPKDFCHDPEEGNIWTGFVLEDLKNEIPTEDNWLQYSSSKHTIFGVYVSNQAGASVNSTNRLVSGGKYKLICRDGFERIASHAFETWIAIEEQQFSAAFRLQFTAHSQHPLTGFFKQLSVAFNSSTSQIKVKSYIINRLASHNQSYRIDVTWFNKSNPGQKEAAELRSILFDDQRKLRPALVKLFSPDFDTIIDYSFATTETVGKIATTTTPPRANPEGSPPLIEKQPLAREILFDQTAKNCNGDSPVIIDCEAEGKPTPSYTWFKDGKNLQLEAHEGRISQKPGKGTLVITAPTDDDSGTYECYAKNKWGIASSIPVVVRRMELNSFKGNETMSVTAEEGQPFKLSCGSVAASSKIRAKWVQQNAEGDFRSIDSSRIIVDPEGHLWFFKVMKEDQSQDFFYVCFFSSMLQNEYNIGSRVYLKVEPKNISKSVEKRSPVPLYTTSNYTVALRGQQVEMSCIFAGTPLPRISWAREGGELSGDRVLYENNGTTLRIRNVDFSDNGTYSCTAANGVEPAIFHSVHLFVFVAPRFTEEPMIQVKLEGETAELHCKADGRPLPAIKWIHNGAPLHEAPFNPRRKFLEDGTILIENVTKADVGNYGCNATNTFSYVYKEVYVNVITESSEGSSPMLSKTSIAISSAVVIILLSFVVLIAALWKKYNRPTKETRNMTKEEVDEFYCGKNGEECFDNGVPVECLPFMDHKKIRSEDLEIESTVLGEGEFGIVHKGRLRDECVAVKSSKSAANIDHFKAFLQEIKLMAYIDEHENVVRFYGAVVENIQDRVCSAVMEFSPFGNLKDYLRIHSKEFSRTSLKKEGSRISAKLALTPDMLMQFCKQIASGMEFLAQKKVIHGDLAARNILVYEKGVVKVTDFGLSRKLYDCANYTKKKQVPLPWRWMAIESLRFFEFSTPSDVWSFGVTTWEIFSLSQVPFTGLQWTTDLADKLESGLRLSKPKHCNPIVYDWMMRCWATIPHNRPTFLECQKFFASPIGNDNNRSHTIDRTTRICDVILV